jgi:hypothetical protein
MQDTWTLKAGICLRLPEAMPAKTKSDFYAVTRYLLLRNHIRALRVLPALAHLRFGLRLRLSWLLSVFLLASVVTVVCLDIVGPVYTQNIIASVAQCRGPCRVCTSFVGHRLLDEPYSCFAVVALYKVQTVAKCCARLAAKPQGAAGLFSNCWLKCKAAIWKF